MNALREGMGQGFREIRASPFRAALTIFAVALGVAALVAMLGVLESMLAAMKNYNKDRGGLNKITVIEQAVPAEQAHLKYLSAGRSLRDVEALRRNATFVRNISPEVDLSWLPVAHSAQSDWAMIHGSTAAVADLYGLELARGRFLSDLDVDQFAPVCVLGSEVTLQIFPPGQPVLGQKVRIGAHAFTVVGQLRRYDSRQSGRNALWRRNWSVWIPITTAQKRFTGTRRVDALEMQVTDLTQLIPAMDEVESIVRPMHRWVRDFNVENQLATLQDFGRQQERLRASLGGVAALSLLIGGIGVMSVMLAGVNDRIREIGVRKALGAQHTDIFLQFLFESMGVSLLGGLAGVMGGIGLVRILGQIMVEQPPVLLPGALYLGTVASIATGLLAGIYPALRAAALEPIDALRAE
jgi:ABC-type antimicrobial peptide transport system permease subunit